MRFNLFNSVMAFGLASGINGLSGPIAEEMLPPLPPLTMAFGNNDSLFDCPSVYCSLFDEIGPPPDWLPPPPPLPPYFQQILIDNQSIGNDKDSSGSCNFCHIFSNPQDSELVVPDVAVKAHDTWFSLLIASVLGSAFIGILLVLVLIKCRKWKIFSASVCGLDSCPIFPESLIGGHKAAPPPCSPSDNCISPVVNEKSPQSVITSCPTKTSISSKYWRRSDENPTRDCGMMDPGTTEIDEYTSVPEGGSCTSSPVYAELDAAGVTINHSQIPSSLLMEGQSISPYSVHTYSEVADAMRMAALGSSTALLPDASYDNVAYLPSSNSDQYQGRSLRRQRASGMSHLGSATPLLSSQHHVINTPINYLTGGRPHKKPRPAYAHQTARINSRSHLQQQPLEGERARYLGPRRSVEGVYSDLPLNSSLSTFRVPYALNFREHPKRPLPSVPGVRL